MVIEGGNVIERVLGGMDWALGQGARILSMSLGFRGFVDDFEPITRILRQRNVLPVFAVGNEGPGFSRSPGNYFNALSVGASDNKMKVASFSSSQKFSRALDPNVPDLVAPGVNVSSAAPGGGYQAMDGSSMATPHIAGLAALLLQAVPSATVDQLEAAIFKSCTLPASMSAERANRGFPNAVRALSLLLPSPAGGGGGGLLPSIFPKLGRAGTAKSKKAQKTAGKSVTKKRK
jgi:subtilisin family serine protease